MGRISSISRGGNSDHQTRRALSLIELVVVIAIIGLLAVLLLTAIQSARESGRRAVCAANLHQMGVATASYYDVNGYFPPGTGGGTTSLHVALLPYLEQQAWRPISDRSSSVRATRACASRIPSQLK